MAPITTRDRILEAAIDEFRQRGFRGTSLKEISAAGPATIGSIYHAFPGGKDELGAAAVERSGAAYQELVALVMDAHPDIAAGVAAAFEGAADALVELDYADLCPIGTIAAEVAGSNDVLRAATAAVFERWHEAMRARLTAAGISAADDLAGALIAALEGSFTLARSARDPEPVRRAGRVMAGAVAAARPAP